MRTKHGVHQKLKGYLADYGTPCILRTVSGNEYTKKIKKLCTNNKIKREYAVPETPAQKCVAER